MITRVWHRLLFTIILAIATYVGYTYYNARAHIRAHYYAWPVYGYLGLCAGYYTLPLHDSTICNHVGSL